LGTSRGGIRRREEGGGSREEEGKKQDWGESTLTNREEEPFNQREFGSVGRVVRIRVIQI
jgi:hypothetical protein